MGKKPSLNATESKTSLQSLTRLSKIAAVAAGLVVVGGVYSLFQPKLPRDIPRQEIVIQGFPAQYGTVLYQSKPTAQKQLCIIGQEHGDPVTGFDPEIPFIQMEVYRLGRYALQKQDSRLILAEGETIDRDDFEHSRRIVKKYSDFLEEGWKGEFTTAEFLNIATDEDLVMLIKDTTSLLGKQNGAFLLLHPGVYYQGAEDPVARKTGSKDMDEMDELNPLCKRNNIRTSDDLRKFPDLLARVNAFNLSQNYHSEIRSAYILKNAPTIIDQEFAKGRISNHNATIIIGSGHLDEMIRFAQANKAVVKGYDSEHPDFELSLNIQDYGVTIVLPRGALYTEGAEIIK